MSGGNGGVIILKIAEESTEPEKTELQKIHDRSVTGCSLIDALRVLRIVWKLLRR
jgi:hypothetical protein